MAESLLCLGDMAEWPSISSDEREMLVERSSSASKDEEWERKDLLDA